MRTTPTLNKHHQQTYDAILRHPIARRLHRHYVLAMLADLGELVAAPSGDIKVTLNGHTLVLHAARDRTISTIDELLSIRHFLERSVMPAGAAPADAGEFLVVLDHREARIYKTELHGAVPQRIVPFDPQGFGRHLRYVEDDATGQRKPESKSFYEAIARALKTARGILLFGNGTGASSAMAQLVAVLAADYPEVARHIVASCTLDTQHLTENQLLARARELYAKPAGQ